MSTPNKGLYIREVKVDGDHSLLLGHENENQQRIISLFLNHRENQLTAREKSWINNYVGGLNIYSANRKG